MCKMTAETVTVRHIISDANGVYCPQVFAKSFDGGNLCDRDGNELDNDRIEEILEMLRETDPNDSEPEGYWDDWQYILDNLYIYEETHNGASCDVYCLYQNGSVWAIKMKDLDQLDEEETEKFWENMNC
jgi:hypothetical protein